MPMVFPESEENVSMKKLKFVLSAALVALALGAGGLFVTSAGTANAAPPADKTMGNSHSNPDGGGVDKPYDADGQPANSQGDADTLPADGNNGCGQEKHAGEIGDASGLDDNNGHCGNKHDAPPPPGEED
jgi:hypothetical protein